MNTYDLADATADLLSEQRHAMLERAGITVDCYLGLDETTTWWCVQADGNVHEWFKDAAAAYAAAYELAGEQE